MPPGHRNESAEAPEDRTEHAHQETRDKSCSQKVHCTFLKTRSSHRRGDSSGSQVALGQGPRHFRVHEVRLQLPLPFHVDYSSTRARVAQGLQDEAGLLRHLEAHGKRKAFRAESNTARWKGHLPLRIKSPQMFMFFDPSIPLLRN